MQITCYKIIALFVMLLSAAPVFASGTRTTFLTHGPSAAAYGRGETATASAEDAADAFYNPASLAYIPSHAISVSHFPLLDGTRYNFLGVALPFKRWAFGFSGVNLRSGDIEVRRTITDNPFIIQVNQWACLMTSAYHFKKPFDGAIGATVKNVSLDMYGYRAMGWGLDTGASGRWTGPRLWGNNTMIRGGISVINTVSPSMKLQFENETYPVGYHCGFAVDMPVVYRFASSDILSLYVDTKVEDRQAGCASGVEYAFMNRYIIRGGWYDDHVTTGFGYKNTLFRIDYAMDYSRFALVSKLGMSYYFGRNNEKRKKNTALMNEAKAALSEEKQQRSQRTRDAKILFAAAKDSYRRKQYLTAIEQFRSLRMAYPEFEVAGQYYDDIMSLMDDKSRGVHEDNLEWITYATAFVRYQRKQYPEAVLEWEKVLMFNPDQKEVEEYLAKTKSLLKDELRRRQEKENEGRVEQLLSDGVKAYDAGEWVACIKTMEQVQSLCKSNAYAGAEESYTRAGAYIDNAVKALASSIKRTTRKKKQKSLIKPAETSAQQATDENGSNARYREGLVLYAQGKTADAVRMWEIALRMNPLNDKATKAIERVRSE